MSNEQTGRRIDHVAMTLPLSVLDLSPVGAGTAPSQAIRDSVELARAADELGFTRYWFAEHHNMANIATSAPEILIAHVAAMTKRIRVGAGGMMVPNHAPLHVVEQFRTLEALYPGRIDLGLGRAPGTDPVASRALRRMQADPNAQLAELFAFERRQFPDTHSFTNIDPMPSDARLSSIWMLGSTLDGAGIAADLGLPYAFAGHFAMRHAAAAIDRYKSEFHPSPNQREPYAILAVTVVCAATREEAEQLAAPMRVAIVLNRTGRRAPILSIKDALAFPLTPDECAIADEFFLGAVIGDPAHVADGLAALARETQADEIMLSTLVPSLEARRASLAHVMRAVNPRT